MIIDFHTHIAGKEVRRNLKKYLEMEKWFKEEGFTETSGHPILVGAEELIESMDKAGVDKAVITGFPWTDHDLIVKENDYIIESVEKYPDRLIGLAQVHLLAGEEAVEEIERCAAQGLRGIGELEWVQQCLSLDPDVMRPIAEAASKHDFPILIHTGDPIGPERLVKAGRGKTFPSLIYKLARDFPDLTIVSAHWGGGLFFYELIPDVRKVTTNVYYDTSASPIVYEYEVFRIASELCPNKILFGTDYPLIRQGELIEQVKKLNLPKDVASKILGENAKRLLKI